MEINVTIILLIIFLSIVQSIAGVGVLLLGTPIIMFMNYSIIDAISVLLPLSILTSFYNLIIFKLNSTKVNHSNNIKLIFFLLCIPGVIIGTLLLKNIQNNINIEIVLSVVIAASIITKIRFENNLKKYLSNNVKKIALVVIGAIHGFTNMGGTLLTLFISTINRGAKELSRYQITYFYFYLALMQFLFFIIIFKHRPQINLVLFACVTIGIILGNILIKYTDQKKFNFVIYLLSIINVIYLSVRGFSKIIV
jgi:uncharacterized membrane protein YfcA